VNLGSWRRLWPVNRTAGATLELGAGGHRLCRGCSTERAESSSIRRTWDGAMSPSRAHRTNRSNARSCWKNDVNAITWGESRFGRGQGIRQQHRCLSRHGRWGWRCAQQPTLTAAAAMSVWRSGSCPVVPGGRPCGCGAHGCLEAYVGGAHLAEMAREKPSALLLGLAGGDKSALHAGHLDRAARQGDDRAKQLIRPGRCFPGRRSRAMSRCCQSPIVWFSVARSGRAVKSCATSRSRVFASLDPARGEAACKACASRIAGDRRRDWRGTIWRCGSIGA